MTNVSNSNLENNSIEALNPLIPPIDKFFQIIDFTKYTQENGGAYPNSIPDLATALSLSIEQVEYVMRWYIEKGAEMEKSDYLNIEAQVL